MNPELRDRRESVTYTRRWSLRPTGCSTRTVDLSWTSTSIDLRQTSDVRGYDLSFKKELPIRPVEQRYIWCPESLIRIYRFRTSHSRYIDSSFLSTRLLVFTQTDQGVYLSSWQLVLQNPPFCRNLHSVLSRPSVLSGFRFLRPLLLPSMLRQGQIDQ